mgnify:FL=1
MGHVVAGLPHKAEAMKLGDGRRRAILRALTEQGWRVSETASSHIRAVPPDKAMRAVVTGGTPSDHRQMVKWLSDLHRSGFVWPHRDSALEVEEKSI